MKNENQEREGEGESSVLKLGGKAEKGPCFFHVSVVPLIHTHVHYVTFPFTMLLINSLKLAYGGFYA